MRNAAPRNDISPPSVTTKDGTPSIAVNVPWYIETRMATPSPARHAANHGQSDVYIRNAIRTPTKPITEPTDRSM